MCIFSSYIYATFVHFDNNIFGYLEEESSLLYLFDMAIDTTSGDHFVAFLECLALLLQFFLFLLLWADHEEVEYHKNQDHHYPE